MRVFSVPVSVPFLRTVIAALVDGRLVDGFEARARPGTAGARHALSADPARRTHGAGNLSRRAARPTPRCCRASSRSAISTKTNWRSPKPSEPMAARRRWIFAPKLGRARAPADAGATGRAWAKTARSSAPLVVGGPASTLALAGDLARLMDDMVTRGVDWNALDGLVPDQLDQYWQHPLDFLQIARQVLAGAFWRKSARSSRRRGAIF